MASKPKFYMVYFEVRRLGKSFLGKALSFATSKKDAAEYIKSSFGYKDPHPFFVNVFAEGADTKDALVNIYGENMVNDIWKWDIDKMCLVRTTDGKERRV